MTGAFNARPPKVRYTKTWDVGLFVQYIQDLGPNPSLDLKTLKLKLCRLIALIAASRQHEIQLLDPSTMSWFHDRVVCYASKLTKGDTQNTKKEQFKDILYQFIVL